VEIAMAIGGTMPAAMTVAMITSGAPPVVAAAESPVVAKT
jgi:hypothetical protein